MSAPGHTSVKEVEAEVDRLSAERLRTQFLQRAEQCRVEAEQHSIDAEVLICRANEAHARARDFERFARNVDRGNDA